MAIVDQHSTAGRRRPYQPRRAPRSKAIMDDRELSKGVDSLRHEVSRLYGVMMPPVAAEGDTLIYTSGRWTTVAPSAGGTTRTILGVSINTLLTAVHDIVLVDATADPIVIILPTAVGNTGRAYTVKKYVGPNDVTVTPQGGEGIDGSSTAVISTLMDAIEFISDGANWWII